MYSVSVIVPVFNKESSILKCLHSICEQEYKQIEVIVIDDGSTDNSLSIAKNYLKSTNIQYKIIEQENKGPSAARNRGMDLSNGDYFMFVDADDYLLSGAIQRLIDLAVKYDADLVECGYANKPGDYGSSEDVLEIKGRVQCIQSLFNDGRIKPVIWASLYRIRKISRVRFIESLHLGEDTCFKVGCINHDLKVICVNDVLYINVTQNTNTLSRKKLNDVDVNSIVAYLKSIEHTVSGISELNRDLYRYLYRISVSYYARLIRDGYTGSESECVNLYRLISEYRKHVNLCSVKYRIEIFILKNNKRLYLLLYRLLKGGA